MKNDKKDKLSVKDSEQIISDSNINEHLLKISNIIRRNCRGDEEDNLVLALSLYLKKNGYSLDNTIQIVKQTFNTDKEIDGLLKTVDISYKQEMDKLIGFKDLNSHLNPHDVDELKKLVSGTSTDLKDNIVSAISKNRNPGNKLLADFVNSKLELCVYTRLIKYYERSEDGSINEIDENRIISFTNSVFGYNQISRKQCRNMLNYVTNQISRNYNLIEFKNGILNTKTRVFEENKKTIEELPKLSLPFDYNKNARSGKIGELVDRILFSSEYPENEELWYRAVGHAFMATNRIGKMVMVQGESGTGKSTLTTILKRIFCNSYSENKTQDIVKDERFTLYPLIGKAINIDDDISNGMLRRIGNLNTICTGNGLQVEVKGESKAIQADNQEIPRLFANGNTLPPVVGTGFERRLLLIHADNKIPYNEKDEYLQSDIISGKYDTNGIEWLVYHCINLYLDKENKPLTSKDTERKMMEAYEFYSNPLKKAIESIFVESYEDIDYIPAKTVHKFIKAWCKWALKHNKISREHLNPSYSDLNRAMDYSGFSKVRKRTDDGHIYVYEDIRINSDWEYLLMPNKSLEGQSKLTELKQEA